MADRQPLVSLSRRILARSAGAIVASDGRATLSIRDDGRLLCSCPYLCLATYEDCAFADKSESEWVAEWRKSKKEHG